MSSNPIWGDDWQDVRRLWALDPEVAHCNHGSFGAVPRPVLEVQEQFRQRMVANPMQWFHRDLPDLIGQARGEVAEFLGADSFGIAFVTNVSAGVSTVLQALPVEPDTEVLCTDHAYGAVGLAMDRFCARTGAVRVVAHIPIDSTDEDVVSILAEHCTERTRLLVVDHVTSSTGRLFPVERIARMARDAGVLSVVDGAHAPGMLPLDLPRIAADFWVGNLHKWPCAPAGTAALWVAPEHRDRIRPLVVSHADHEGFPAAFDRVGTNDLSAWLSAPRALELFGNLGWERVRTHNENLVRHGQRAVADILGVPEGKLRHDPGLSLALVPLPPGLIDTREQAQTLQDHLAARGVEMATSRWNNRPALRLSAQVYNQPADYERLAIGIRQFMIG